MKFRAVLFFLFCLVSQIFAQSPNIDSLRISLTNEEEPEEQIILLNELARELIRIAPDEALHYANKLKKISDSVKSVSGHAHYYRIMSGISAIQGNYLYSTSFVFQAIKLYEQLHDSAGIANSYITLSNNYSRQKLYVQAIHYQKEALKIFEKIHKENRIGVCLTNLTFLYNSLGKYDTALIVGTKSIVMNESNKYYPILANDYKNVGFTFYYKKDYPQALQYFNKAVNLSSQQNKGFMSEAIIETYIGLGCVNMEMGKRKEGYEFLSRAIDYALKNGFLSWAREGYLYTSKYYEQEGKHQEALQNLTKHLKMVDSLSSILRTEQINLGDVYLNALKDSYQNDLLIKEKELKEEVVKQQRLGIILGAVAILVLLLLLFFLKKINTKRRRVNEMLTRQKEEIAGKKIELEKLVTTKDKFFSIIAHDLRSPLNSLKSFTSLINQHADHLTKEEIVTTGKQLDSTIDSTIKMVDNLLTWAKQQMQIHEHTPERVFITPLVNDLLGLYQQAADQKKIVLQNNITGEVFAFADKNHLTFIIRNLLNNAIKFTQPGGTITLLAKMNDQQTQLSVNDTGIGMSSLAIEKLFEIHVSGKTYGTAGEKGTGLGLILCKEFANQNKGKIWVESELGRGSTFHLILPQ